MLEENGRKWFAILYTNVNFTVTRLLSCNAENAVDKIPPLDFTEANDIVCRALARRGLSDALPIDVALRYGDGDGRCVRGGCVGRSGVHNTTQHGRSSN